jgi:transposase-like protein
MDLSPSVYPRELKLSAIRALDAGETHAQVARRLQLSPKLLERWRSEWRAKGEAAFPGCGRRRPQVLASEQQRQAELERKVGQLTMENEFLKKALDHFREHHPPVVVSGGAVCTSKSKKPRKQEAR